MPKCKGKAMWAFTQQPDSKYNCWKVALYIDSTEAKKMIDLGLKKQVRRVDPLMEPDNAALGEYVIKFSRYVNGKGKAAGKKNPKPEVINVDNEPFDEIIGNGSDVIVRFNVYKWGPNQFGSGIGTDLDGIKVINHIPYAPVETVADTKEEESTVEAAEEDKW